jgi:hypothetical protein
VGRTQQILGTLALSAVSGWANASEAPAAEASTTAPAETPVAARVIWAAPGEAPPPPHLSLPVEEPAPRKRRFNVARVRWLVGLERASSIAGYRSSASVGGDSEVITRGIEASIVGDVNQQAFTPLVMPRLSLDARWANGFSLGAVLSYAARSAEQNSDGLDDPLPSSESALLGPRIGWLKPLSNNVAVWLRGGPTWAYRASSDPTSEPGERRTFTERQWAISLEPQLVVMPWPHLGLSLGAALDLGVDGENELAYRGGPFPETSRVRETVSTYGITAGLLALF